MNLSLGSLTLTFCLFLEKKSWIVKYRLDLEPLQVRVHQTCNVFFEHECISVMKFHLAVLDELWSMNLHSALIYKNWKRPRHGTRTTGRTAICSRVSQDTASTAPSETDTACRPPETPQPPSVCATSSLRNWDIRQRNEFELQFHREQHSLKKQLTSKILFCTTVKIW